MSNARMDIGWGFIRIQALLTCHLSLIGAQSPGSSPFGYLVPSEGGAGGGCQFPTEMQGTYKRQDDTHLPSFSESGTRPPIRYEDYFIGPTAIPQWGHCILNQDSNYVLALKKASGDICYRCFVISQRTPNIVQVLTRNGSDPDVAYAYCPVVGKAGLGYRAGAGMACPYPSPTPSTISNCRLGYQLDINLRACTFTNQQELHFRCLGEWDSGKGNGEKYFGVYNVEAEEYRCGLYQDLKDREMAVAALSNDSSCSNLLYNSSSGFENFVFHKQAQRPWPVLESRCKFPPEYIGDWGLLNVSEELLSYYHHHDPSTMSTQYGKCVQGQDGVFKIFSKNHCGESGGYSCLQMKLRSRGVMEFKMGNQVLQHNDQFQCQSSNIFSNSSWITLAEPEPSELIECPYRGHYTTVPDRVTPKGYCFNVTVDCLRPHLMQTVGFICGTNSVFDKRDYQCMGNWREDGMLFSYTSRLQDNNKGCFVSSTVNGRIYMAWTGSTCRRNIDFGQMGAGEMNLFILQESARCEVPSNPVKMGGGKRKPVNSDELSSNSAMPIERANRNRYSDRGKTSGSLPIRSSSAIPFIIILTLLKFIFFSNLMHF